MSRPVSTWPRTDPTTAGQFSVEDNGIGIDAAFVEKVFDVFWRVQAEGVFPGTGMGLAICKAIVERHGGRIFVESEKGVGSVISLHVASGMRRESGRRPPQTNLVPNWY